MTLYTRYQRDMRDLSCAVETEEILRLRQKLSIAIACDDKEKYA